MTKPKLMNRLRRARDRVRQDILDNTNRDSVFSRGMATEGFSGGYIAALDDVMLVVNDSEPNREWWRE